MEHWRRNIELSCFKTWTPLHTAPASGAEWRWVIWRDMMLCIIMRCMVTVPPTVRERVPLAQVQKRWKKRLISLLQMWGISWSSPLIAAYAAPPLVALYICKPKGRVTTIVMVGCDFQATICGGIMSICVCGLPKPLVVETQHAQHHMAECRRTKKVFIYFIF